MDSYYSILFPHSSQLLKMSFHYASESDSIQYVLLKSVIDYTYVLLWLSVLKLVADYTYVLLLWLAVIDAIVVIGSYNQAKSTGRSLEERMYCQVFQLAFIQVRGLSLSVRECKGLFLCFGLLLALGFLLAGCSV